MRVKAHSVFVFFLTVVPASFALAFEVYIETNYTNQPDLLSKYGLEDMPMIYGNVFWSSGQDMQLLPSKDRVISQVKAYVNLRASQGKPITKYLLLDIEHWGLIGDDAEITSNVNKLVTVLQWAKLGVPPGITVSYYGFPPTGGYWPAQSPGSQSYKTWQHRNDLLKPLADQENVLFTSFYSITSNQDTWKTVVTELIKEGKRISGNKPVIMVFNPRYHPAAYGGIGYDYIPQDFFAMQLQHIKDQGANGVVIWGADLKAHTWDENRDWWVAVKEFLGLK